MARGTISPLFSWRSAICDSDLPAPARHVALTLSLHMSERGDSCFPSIATLMSESGLSKATVCRHIATLERLGWLGREAGGGRRSTRYTATVPETGPVSEGDSSSLTDGHEDVIEGDKEDQDLSAGKPPKARNPIWDALEAVTGYQPATSGEASDFGKTVGEIKRAIPADASYEDVLAAMEARKVAFHRKYEGAVFTHRVLRNKWGELGEEAKHGRFVGGFTSGVPRELPEGETF